MTPCKPCNETSTATWLERRRYDRTHSKCRATVGSRRNECHGFSKPAARISRAAGRTAGALNADLLMDLDPGETWWHYRTLLLDLPAETVTEFKTHGI